MKTERIKPIPKYILELIRKKDIHDYQAQDGHVRFYAYLTKNDCELVKMTVAVKTHRKKWYCKQVALHGISSDRCYLKDMIFYYIGGYVVGWYEQGLTKQLKWYEDTEWGWNDDHLFDPYAPIVNKEYLAKYPKYKYAAWELYSGTDILQYLRLYEKYSQTEYLIKLGLENYVKSRFILEKIEKDTRFRKWLSKNREELKAKNCYITTIIQAYSKNKPLAEIQAFETVKKELRYNTAYKPIQELFKNDLERFFHYIGKQQTNISSYADYLKACNYLELSMAIEKNRFPHDFKRWHDIRIDEYHTAKALAEAKESAKLEAQFTSIAKKYLPMEYCNNDNYVICIARSRVDLVREGEALHHCVGRMNYDQRMIREESLIFFIRNAGNPDVSFVTIEYSPKNKKVLQCYGMNNTKPEDNVLTYINKVWLPYANRKIKKLQSAA